MQLSPLQGARPAPIQFQGVQLTGTAFRDRPADDWRRDGFAYHFTLTDDSIDEYSSLTGTETTNEVTILTPFDQHYIMRSIALLQDGTWVSASLQQMKDMVKLLKDPTMDTSQAGKLTIEYVQGKIYDSIIGRLLQMGRERPDETATILHQAMDSLFQYFDSNPTPTEQP